MLKLMVSLLAICTLSAAVSALPIATLPFDSADHFNPGSRLSIDDDDDDDDEDDDENGARGRLVAYGLTSDGRLVRFETSNPRKVRQFGTISGFVGGDSRLVGIDFRVQDGRLYGVGNGGGVYTIDLANATLAFVNSLTVPLNGTFFGVDFNPAADRLRIISDTGQNLRHNVNPGGTTINDGTLSYAPPTAAPGITAGAYTNNDLDASTSTTLFDIDVNLDQVAIQSPANAGTLAATGKLTVDANGDAGFDIYSVVRNGTSIGSRGFAVITTANGRNGLYSIDLLTGKATLIGYFRGSLSVVDIALPLAQ